MVRNGSLHLLCVKGTVLEVWVLRNLTDSFNKYLSSAYYVGDTVLSIDEIVFFFKSVPSWSLYYDERDCF